MRENRRLSQFIILMFVTILGLGWQQPKERDLAAVQSSDAKFDPVIAKLFDEADDFQLCDALCVACESQNANSRPQIVVTLLWSAGGIIGNGGFQYLFSSDIDVAKVAKYHAHG